MVKVESGAYGAAFDDIIFIMRIAIISGGKNKGGSSIVSADNLFLELEGHTSKIFNIKINHSNEWVSSGIKITPHSSLIHVDYIIDLTHDAHDEKTKKFIKSLGLRHLLDEEYDHNFVRGVARQLNIDLPRHHTIEKGANLLETLHEKWRQVHVPVYVRGINNKVLTVNTSTPSELYEHVLHIHKNNFDVILDEQVRGKKYTIVSISKFRGESVYLTPIIENIGLHRKSYVTAKVILDKDKNTLMEAALKLHESIGSKLLKQDFVITKKGPVLVNVETRPKYDNDSSFYNALNILGINFLEILKSFK